jgi:hypothetical protein
MVVDGTNADLLDAPIYRIVEEFMELAERSGDSNPALFLSRHSNCAPELQDFFQTWHTIDTLAAPVRWLSQKLLEATARGDCGAEWSGVPRNQGGTGPDPSTCRAGEILPGNPVIMSS